LAAMAIAMPQLLDIRIWSMVANIVDLKTRPARGALRVHARSGRENSDYREEL